ncbi:AraC family transcriptional regulator [Bosea thiooxidans]|uniref:AraC family transcriptional regulator n=1 Tax=Bosea thiooxidans TaxID=53254 RepID=A0A0Q3T3L1_9HYPH|nr:helix-turn-helix transcriptional regulator [Bosea thiooxidans]KQK32234.1 AraC family transcriptional regulator [Bosea thiooxidans]SKC10315.1 AraC-type DNA-binding protein [Bosea thiooxidans]
MRSTRADDYQHVPRPVAVLAKEFASGATTGRHSHPRAQLLYAIEGLMIAATDDGTWAVPAGHALLIPPGVAHEISMHGTVAMRTAYLVSQSLALPRFCQVVRVSVLLNATLLALAEEPVLYDEDGRGGHLASLVLDEIARAPTTPLALPLPHDGRLRRLCRALIEAPHLPHDIDVWSDRIGVSRRTLTRRFRSETGFSFAEWRRRLRLLEVMARQARGDAMPGIAAAVGYGSPRALRSMMSRTPRGPGSQGSTSP